MAQNEYLVDGADMTVVADAIRAKGGTTAPLSFPAWVCAWTKPPCSASSKPPAARNAPPFPSTKRCWKKSSPTPSAAV